MKKGVRSEPKPHPLRSDDFETVDDTHQPHASLSRCAAGPNTGIAQQNGDTVVSLPAVLTVDELAAYLRLNRKTVYAAIAAGELPGARRIGGTIRINRDTVLAWLSGEGRVPSSGSKP